MSLLIFYVGLATAQPRLVDPGLAGYPFVLFAAAIVAVSGWLHRVWLPRGYVPLAVLLSLWSVASAVAVWEYVSFYRARFLVVWLLFLIPGLASMLRDERLRSSYIAGFAAGVITFVAVATWRLASGGVVFDDDVGTENMLLGFNRNAVSLRVVMLVPVLLAALGPRWLRRIRWPLLGLCTIWILFSGGRAGFMGLALVVLVFALLQPRSGRRLRQVYTAVFAGLVLFIVVSEAGGEASRSLDRLVVTLQGEREVSDDARVLLFRKAGSLATDNPLFGIGYGTFAATYDPVVEEGQVRHERELASSQQSHNTYAEFLAETGFPGALAFVALVVLLFVYGIRNRHDRDTRTWLCSFAGLAFVMLFATLRQPVLYCTVAALIGTLAGRMRDGTVQRVDEAHPS